MPPESQAAVAIFCSSYPHRDLHSFPTRRSSDLGETRIPGELGGKHVVIVDDVLYTGRTVRAALDELADFGRPKRISLCVLVDRGGRELPIHPDIVGKQVKVNSGARVDVLVGELDGRDEVALVRQGASA